MTHPSPHALGLTAWLVIFSFAFLAIAGLIWHGVTEETFERLWQNLIDRPNRQMAFRFILQPSMAAIFAVRHGISDARSNRTPYLWTIIRVPGRRVERLREGLNATAKIMLVALVIDIAYQALELKTLYPVEALIIALLLAFIPYVLLRGLVARVARAAGITSHG